MVGESAQSMTSWCLGYRRSIMPSQASGSSGSGGFTWLVVALQGLRLSDHFQPYLEMLLKAEPGTF